MKRIVLIAAGWLVCSSMTAGGGEIGYIEDFALAQDRSVALRQLIPGTEEFYYYHALHYQNLEQFDRVEQLLQAWIKRYNYTPRVREIQNRQALLTYRLHPAQTLEYLQRTLNLQFNHQRDTVGARPDLPSQLDVSLLDRDRLMQEALRDYQNLDGFEDNALDWLIQTELPSDRRRHLLARLGRPDYPKLVRLVVEDLNQAGSGGFGSLPIHRLLVLEQLDECLKLKPDLLNQAEFINVYLSKLRPSDDVDLRKNADAELAYLERLWAFVERLAPSQNSLKVHVLYHRLLLDRSRGIYDKPRFMQYIELPRVASYVNPKYIAQDSVRQFAASLEADFASLTEFPPVLDDEPLVKSYLQHFFLTEATYKPYELYLDDTYLKHTFAETKIVFGLGDAEQWSALLPPEKFQELKQRVDLDFAYTNRRTFAADEPIRLDLQVKNVPTLIVKVYEINTYNYYRENAREVNTDVNLDGLVANQEQTTRYDEAPLRRVARHFEFPELTEPGVYVVDFIGNGKSSRAVIRKGQLRYLARAGTAGHVFTILNEANDTLTDASIWLAGREYHAGDDGTIVVPFSTSPGRQPIVLSHGDLSTLDWFEHQAEEYQLAAGIFVDRESLLSRKKAQVLLRPALYLNGNPVTLSVLEDTRLVITSTDLDGVATTKEIPAFKLTEDRESVYEFLVPPRLNTLQFTLQAKVQNLSQNKKLDLSASESFQLNGIDTTDKVEDLHLVNFGGKYVLELLGKTGESKAHRPVQLVIKHRDFKKPVNVTMQSDDNGQLLLGELTNIAQLTAVGPAELPRTWSLAQEQYSFRSTIHGQEGATLTVPYVGTAGEPSRNELSLLEVRGGQFVADRFEAITISGGMIKIADLPRGDYDLLVKKSGDTIRLKIAAGKVSEGYVLGDHRQLELRGEHPLQIQQIVVTEEALKVQLANSGKFSRVHVFATRYEPAFRAYDYLGRIQDRGPLQVVLGTNDSFYAAGRKLGDEYRYIIDRKYAQRFPGNMLERPSLLLNPWAVRKTETGQQRAQEGEDFAPESPPAEADRAASRPGSEKAAETAQFANLDFLAEASAVLVNLVPDQDGVVVLERKILLPYQRVWVVAVDPDDTSCRTVTLPESERSFLDLRLAQGLDPQKHFTQQKQINVVEGGATVQLDDISSARFETYDSLAKVHALLVTLSNNPTLIEFSFVLKWDQRKPEEKRADYSKYACHELNYFLYQKDREFFQAVVLPYLKNKKDKTFLDRWLIGDDLQPYLQPWNYAQLNVVERILLAQRVAEDRPQTQRLVQDLYDLLPPDTDRYNFLFDTAVKGSALDAGDALGRALAEQQTTLGLREGVALQRGALARAGGAGRPSRRSAEKAESAEEEAAPGQDMARFGVEKKREAAKSLNGVDALGAIADKAGAFYKQDRERLAEVRRLYMQMDKTQEWAENNYYHLPIAEQIAELVKVNAFWRDYARHDPSGPFRSIHFAEASTSFTEMMFALSVLDLPFQSSEHETSFEQAKMSLAAKSPLIFFHEEILPAEKVVVETPILVSQNFFRQDDRYRFENNQRVDKYVTDEFLVQTVYGCQVVVTNPTSSPQKLSLLLQVPVGAIPVLNGQMTRSVHADLKPFDTTTIEYFFYFPAPGQFGHYPVQVAKNEQLLASAPAVTLNAVEQLSKIDRQSWQYVSQSGSNEEVLTYLKNENLQRIDLEKIAFRMHDAAFFQSVTQLLASRHVYHPTLWSYAVKHDVPEAMRVFLEHADGFVSQCGAYLDSPLLTIDPVRRKSYQHLDYKPLVNARAHQLGQRRQILNERMLQQYHDLLTILGYRRELSDDQLMAITYYMLLQDRVEEALVFFRRVNPDRLETRVQHDYFAAYLDFFTEDPKLAGPIVERYADYPVDRWRNAFQAMAAQLDEIRGEQAQVVDPENRDQSQTALAATEPAFEFAVESKKIAIKYQHLSEVRINYYLMDIELLFSRNPFVQQYSGQFSTIRPNLMATVALPADQTSIELELPGQLQNSNVLVEITGDGKTRSQAYYANSLNVQVVENYGQVQVRHQTTLKPLPKVYVKVYARMNDGSIQFYKDGYTDLRGRFDYTSLNTNELDSVARFALLVLSDENGAVVREADPPQR